MFTLDNTDGFSATDLVLLNAALDVLVARGIKESNASDLINNRWAPTGNTLASLTTGYSYIVSRNGQRLIAHTEQYVPTGTSVRCAYYFCAEAINANRAKNLVNAFDCKVSNAKKWVSVETQATATEINTGEFFLSYPWQ